MAACFYYIVLTPKAANNDVDFVSANYWEDRICVIRADAVPLGRN